MSRAFVNEDHEPPRKGFVVDLPPRGEAGYDAALARAFLEAARVSQVSDVEEATGVRWGDARLVPHVQRELDAAIAAGDDRLEQVASRYIRSASKK